MPSTVDELSKIQARLSHSCRAGRKISRASRNSRIFRSKRKNYIATLEKLSGLEVALVSVGPDKDQTIIRKEIF
jgi:adenylosuccinate synthase